MKIEPYVFYALLAAFGWSLGGYFEKLGMKEGGFTRPEALMIRLVVSAFFVSCIAGASIGSKMFSAGWRPFLYLAVGGGVIAGFIALLSFYQALHLGPLHMVIGLAFSATILFGFVWASLGSYFPAYFPVVEHITWAKVGWMIWIVVGILGLELYS